MHSHPAPAAWRAAARAVFTGLALCLVSSFAAAAPSIVKVEADGQGWKLTRNGAPYVMHGVGGSNDLELARQHGATTARTWGIDHLEKPVKGRPYLDYVNDLGMTVMVGIWIGHERHGFNYDNPAQVQKQRDEVRAAVRKYRNHPAVLIWGLGNEMEGPSNTGANAKVWRELEVLAKIIKEEDPNHPICTVIAGGDRGKVASLMTHYTSLDILGVNAYGNAPNVGKTLVDVGWKKPFLLTEFGPLGHWEVGKTSWGAPIEPTSRDKAQRYFTTHKQVMEDGKGRCLGTFPFVWGHKQETTGTWYGMFLKSGEKLPSVDAMAYAWNGKWPANRSPAIKSFTSAVDQKRVKAGSPQTARAEITDADGDAWKAEWIVIAESTDRREGGDRESEPPSFPDLIKNARGGEVNFVAPSKRGAYRLFLIVRDGKGGASADNLPFFVE